jgi:hypothetical protein
VEDGSELFHFRRVCGRVVKTDPVTGVDHPFATVHVEDTDCNFFGLVPGGKRSPP